LNFYITFSANEPLAPSASTVCLALISIPG